MTTSPAAPGPTGRSRSVGIVVFDEVEVLDACGPFEVFSVACRVAARERPGSPVPFQVSTLSAGPGLAVRARGGLALTADALLADAGPLDVVVVPGGVTARVETDADAIGWIRDRAAGAEVVAAVCTGAFPLALAGLLDGHRATTHWEDLAELRDRFPALTVVDGARWVDEGAVATSAGVSAGIDLALHLVARLCDGELARLTARQMDYPWQPGVAG